MLQKNQGFSIPYFFGVYVHLDNTLSHPCLILFTTKYLKAGMQSEWNSEFFSKQINEWAYKWIILLPTLYAFRIH